MPVATTDTHAFTTAIVREALDGMQASILDVAEHLDPRDRATAIRVLRDLIAAEHG